MVYKKLGYLFVAIPILAPLSKSYAGDYSRAFYVPFGAIVAAASDHTSKARASYSEDDGDCLKANQQPDLNSNALADELTDEIEKAVAGLQIVDGELVEITDSPTSRRASVSNRSGEAVGWFASLGGESLKAADVEFRISQSQDPGGDYLLIADVVLSSVSETSLGAGFVGVHLLGSSRQNFEFRKSIAIGMIETIDMSREDYQEDPELNPSSPSARRDIFTYDGRGMFEKTETALPENKLVDAARQNGKKTLGFRDCDNEYKSLQESLRESDPTSRSSGSS